MHYVDIPFLRELSEIRIQFPVIFQRPTDFSICGDARIHLCTRRSSVSVVREYRARADTLWSNDQASLVR